MTEIAFSVGVLTLSIIGAAFAPRRQPIVPVIVPLPLTWDDFLRSPLPLFADDVVLYPDRQDDVAIVYNRAAALQRMAHAQR